MRKAIEEALAAQGSTVYAYTDDRMLPLIGQHDRLMIEAVKEPPKVGDVLLCRLRDGQLALLRAVRHRRGKYVMQGDNRPTPEAVISRRRIVGRLTSIDRNGIELPVETPRQNAARHARDMIYLVSCAVNGIAPELARVKGMNAAEIFRLSREHMLTSAVAFALERVVALPHSFDQAKKKAIRKLALFETERALITAELEKAGIWYLPLKGILLKDDYPKAAMREMSDNDILVDSTRMTEVRAIMEGLGYTCDMFDEYHHDVYSKPPTIEFEMHHSLFSDAKTPAFSAYYADILSKTVRNGCACRLSDEDFYLYMLCHTFKHYSYGGTGLRSLLDVYVFLRAHPGLNREYLRSELEKLELTAFEEKLRRLSRKVYTGDTLSEAEQNSLDYFLSSGSSGTSEIRDYNRMAKNLGNDDSHASKRRFLRERVFLSDGALQKKYPFVAKHKSLYPLLLIYRPIRGVLSHPGKIIGEYKSIKDFHTKDF